MDPDIKRKPVQTPYMRRDSVFNPEYLDAERALVRFAPLINSIHRHLQSISGKYTNEYDSEDLRSYIQLEFLRLHDKYDPSYGVDYPGYIKMHLERRVRYYVMRNWKRVNQEVLAFDTTGGCIESVRDDKAMGELDRVDCVLSIPLEEIDNETHRDIIRRILEDGEDVHSLAERYGVPARTMTLMIQDAAKHVRRLMDSPPADPGESREEV